MPLAKQDYSEKRNFIRMLVDAKVSITDPVTNQTFEGDSKNLSGDGALLITDHEFKLNQQLNIKISSEQSKLPPLDVEFEVKRVLKLDNEMFEVAGSIKNTN